MLRFFAKHVERTTINTNNYVVLLSHCNIALADLLFHEAMTPSGYFCDNYMGNKSLTASTGYKDSRECPVEISEATSIRAPHPATTRVIFRLPPPNLSDRGLDPQL